MRLQFDDAATSQPIATYNMQAMEPYTALSIPDVERARRQAIDHWRSRADALPGQDPSESFSSAVVEEMDHNLDLFHHGDERFHVPIDVLDTVRSGAEVTGVVAYDQPFARKPDPGQPPLPLKHLFSRDTYRHSVEN